MKSKILGLVAVAMLAGPMAAIGSAVTWNVSGTWTETQGSFAAPLLSLPAVGSAFGLSVTFDTGAANLGFCDGSTSTCAGYDASSLQFALTSPSCVSGVCTSGGAASPYSRIYVGDNDAGFLPNGLPTQEPIDGIWFVLQDGNKRVWRLELFSFDTNVLSSTSLPSTLDSRLKSGPFDFCDPNIANLDPIRCGRFPSTGPSNVGSNFRIIGAVVPEPGTLALLGLGIAGLGLSRRRKA